MQIYLSIDNQPQVPCTSREAQKYLEAGRIQPATCNGQGESGREDGVVKVNKTVGNT